MSKIFDIDFRKGTPREMVSGDSPVATGIQLNRLNKGLAAVHDGNTSKYTYTSGAVGDLGATDVSIVVDFNVKQSGSCILFSKYVNNDNFYQVGQSGSDKLFIYGEVGGSLFTLSSSVDSLVRYKDYHAVIVLKRGTEVLMYLNGALISNTASTPSSVDIAINASLVTGSYDGNQYKCDLYRVEFHNAILTSEERAKLYSEFLQASPIRKTVTKPLTYPKPTDLSALVDARIGNPEADVTVLNVSNFVNGDYITFANATPTGFDAISSGAGVQYCISANEMALEAGKHYLIGVDILLNSGTAPWLNLRGNGWDAAIIDAAIQMVSGANLFLVLCNTTTSTGTLSFHHNSSAGDYSASNITVKEWNGEELVPDADVGFHINKVTTWNSYSGINIIAQDGNAVSVTFATGGSISGAYNYLTNTTYGTLFNDLVAGDKIRIKFRIKVNSGASVNVDFQSGSGQWFGVSYTNTEYQDFDTGVLTYTSGTPFIRFGNLGNGEVVWFEFLSVMKITGLVAAYNMRPSGSTLVDISGDGYNGTIVGPVSSVDGMKFQSSHLDKISFTDVGYDLTAGAFTFAFRCKKNSAPSTMTIMGRASQSSYNFISLNSGFLFIEGNINNDRASAEIADDVNWHDYVIVVNLGIASMYEDGVSLTMADSTIGSAIYLSQIGLMGPSTSPLDGEISDLKIFNYAFTEQQAKDYHNQFANRLQQHHEFKDVGVGSTI